MFSVDRSYKSLSVAVLSITLLVFTLAFRPTIKKQRVLSAAAFVAFSVLLISVGLNRSDSTKVTIWASSIVAGTVGATLVDRSLKTNQILPLSVATLGVWAAAITGFAANNAAPLSTTVPLTVAASAQTALLLLVVRDRPQEDAPAVKKVSYKAVKSNLTF